MLKPTNANHKLILGANLSLAADTEINAGAFDCVVVGGGPAGSTAATLIAMQGNSVLLLEKDLEPKYKIGESLLPSTIHGIAPLLGVSEDLERANFTLKRGGTFRWGSSPDPWTFSFSASTKMAGPTSTAYQVERRVFDRILLDNARKRGVLVRSGCRVTGTIVEEDRVVGLRFRNEIDAREFCSAKYIINASGHEGTLTHSVGNRVHSKYFQNIAVFGYFDKAGRLPEPNRGNIFCAAFEDGWFWYIPLRDDLTSVGAVIDKSRANDLKGGLADALEQFIQKCPPIRDLLAGAERISTGEYGLVRARQDYSYLNTKFWSNGVALVGDAACFVDPVFSSGVHLATYSALLAARSVNTCLRGDIDEERCFTEFENRYRREYANFYDFLLAFYNLEQDLPSYFWEAKKVTKAAEPEDEAFLNLVGGLSTREGLYQTSSFVENKAGFGAQLFPAAKDGANAPELSAQATDFYRDLTSEITQMQIQAMLKERRPAEQPVFEGGLVPSPDGMHWMQSDEELW